MAPKLGIGLPQWVSDALGLRAGRQQWEEHAAFSDLVLPVVVLAQPGSTTGGTSGGSAGAAAQRFGLARSPGAVAAQYPIVQLWNPAGSGKVLQLARIHVIAPGAGAWDLSLYNTNIGGSAVSGLNYDSGAGVSGGKVHEATTGTLGVGGLSVLMRSMPALSESMEVSLPRPVVLQEGEGALVQWRVVNVAPTIAFEWDE